MGTPGPYLKILITLHGVVKICYRVWRGPRHFHIFPSFCLSCCLSHMHSYLHNRYRRTLYEMTCFPSTSELVAKKFSLKKIKPICFWAPMNLNLYLVCRLFNLKAFSEWERPSVNDLFRLVAAGKQCRCSEWEVFYFFSPLGLSEKCSLLCV